MNIINKTNEINTLWDFYKSKHHKYQILLDTQTYKKNNSTDVCTIILHLDDQVFEHLLCFPKSKNTHKIYLPQDSGIWNEQLGEYEIIYTINCIRTRIDDIIIKGLRELVNTLEYKCQSYDKIKKELFTSNILLIKNHIKTIENLYSKLGSSTFLNSVVKAIINKRIISTKETGITQDIFNKHKRCIGFSDGIYDITTSTLYNSCSAYKYYITHGVEYMYEDVLNVNETDYQDYLGFICKIHPNEEIRNYLIKMLSNALQKINNQIVLIHYNVNGSNGKSTLFKLIKLVFGMLFIKCNSSLLYPSSLNTPGSANEELMSVKDKSIVLFSEPTHKQKLNTAFLKELTGGDEQSSRGLHNSKETFEFAGQPHILCNKIPELDDVCGGIERRIKCIPYESKFVDDIEKVDESNNIYELDKTIEEKFHIWKYCMMRHLIAISKIEIKEPNQVQQHTFKLLKRENITKAFIEDNIEKTDRRDSIIKMQEIIARYKDYCRINDYTPIKSKFLKEELISILGPITEKSNNISNFWRCYKYKSSSEEHYNDDEVSD